MLGDPQTAAGYARGGSYAQLAALVPCDARTLDLACGGYPSSGLGVDASITALRDRPRAICADARALPFADGSFDVVTCHLAFMLFPDPPRVVAELARVLVPGGRFLAVLGGGPTAEGDDALAWFADRLPPRPGPAALTEARWAQLFAGWDTGPWERWALDLDGGLDEVAATLAANHPVVDRTALRDAFPTDPIRCRAAAYLARATLRR